MLILKSNFHITDKQIEELEKKLSDKIKETVCIIPYGFEVVKDLEEIEEENKNKSDLSITVGVEVDEKSFEYAKRKIGELNYRGGFSVITKNEYIEGYICRSGVDTNIDFIKDHWNKISGGFDFIIGTEKEYYSVERFNEIIRGLLYEGKL